MQQTITTDQKASNALWQAIDMAGEGGQLILSSTHSTVISNQGAVLDFEVRPIGVKVVEG